jgi:uncharacterized repeat protein (TIGR01451 family)
MIPLSAGDLTCATPIDVSPAKTVSGAGNYTSGDYATTTAGIYRWTAHYSGDLNNTAMDTACNDANESSTVDPAGAALTLVKTPTPATFAHLGDVISYTYVLSNTGNVPLSGPFTVIDNRVTVTCPQPGSLAVNASITCSASYAIQQADLSAGSVTNTATGSAYYSAVLITSNTAQAIVTSHRLFLPLVRR